MMFKIKPRPIFSRETMVGWVDLLGYSKQISDAEFDPDNPKAKEPISRLRKFHRIVREHSSRSFRTLTLNDGATAYRDHHKTSPKHAYDFIRQCWHLFQVVLEEDAIGARMVIATGKRAGGSGAGIDQSQNDFGRIINRFANKEITLDEALEKARYVQRHSDIIPELQSNYAFSKAYVIESSGSKGDILHNQCYIDMDFFKNSETPTNWVKADMPFFWSHGRFSATLARLQSVGTLEKYSAQETGLVFTPREIKPSHNKRRKV